MRQVRPHAARQAGFTLVELLTASTLTLLILGAVVFASRGFISRLAASGETQEMVERAALLQAKLQADFDTAGRDFIQPELVPSGSVQLTFSGNPEYQSSPSRLLRMERHGDDNPVLANRVLASGAGRFSFNSDPEQEAAAEVMLATNGNALNANRGFRLDASSWTVVEDGRDVARSNSANQPQRGDGYLMQIDYPAGATPTLSYYLRRGEQTFLLYRSLQTLPSFPLIPMVRHLTPGASLFDLTLAGGSMPSREANAATMALLPFDAQNRERLAAPVQMAGDGFGFLLLRSDADLDSLTLTQTARIEDGVALQVTAAGRGELREGDFLLLADFAARRSVILQARSVNSPEEFAALPVFEAENAAWGRLYSPKTDWAEHDFPAGSVIFKLAAPVEWNALKRDSGWEVRRREGTEDWVTVDLSLKSFTAREELTSAGVSYFVEGEVMAETVELSVKRDAAPTHPFSFTFTPAPLNTAYAPY
jgi:hypothetical protein